jgi:uncharacterized protein (DUF2235 family)
MSTGPFNSTPAPDASPSGVARKPRTLVLCFDGTSNEYGKNVTNVIKLYSLLRKDRVEEQLCYYQVSAPFCSFQHSYVFVGGNRNVLRAGCR